MKYENETEVVAHEHVCSVCGATYTCASDALESASGGIVHYGFLNREYGCLLGDTEARRRRATHCNKCLTKAIFG